MNDNGFILLSRSILDSDVFASQKLLKIWVWCLCKANYKDRTIPLKVGKGERLIKVKRGSFIFGRFKAEEQLFIDGSTIYKLMKKLKELEMITIDSNNQYSIVSICNYDIYQNADNYKVASKEQPSNSRRTAEEQPSNTNKNDKKEKNDKEDSYTEFIKLFNSITGRKFRGCEKSKKQFNARLKKFSLNDFEVAIKNANSNSYLTDNNYLTPEYITRSDKLDKWSSDEGKKTLEERYRQHYSENQSKKVASGYAMLIKLKKDILYKFDDIITIDEFSKLNLNGNLEPIIISFQNYGKTKNEFLTNLGIHVRKY